MRSRWYADPVPSASSASLRATLRGPSKRSSTSTMLEELYVENLGIIRTARLEPGAGLVAVTGETGTGKTLLLGALRLLRGDAARTDRVGPHGDEARAEGRFTIGSSGAGGGRRGGGGG